MVARLPLLPALCFAVLVAIGLRSVQPTPHTTFHTRTPPATAQPAAPPAAPELGAGASAGAARVLARADGALPDGTSVFDATVPGVARLDGDLLAALRAAATAAADDGVRIVVHSGWRSRSYQAQLYQEAVATYGSAAEASRWVATPDRSAHVTGDAVDVGPTKATAWLEKQGSTYGLCRTYRNEPWHFELRPEARTGGCPRPYADAAHDPRLRG